jgi:hypothetical protein
MAFRLLMLSAMYENGGNTTHRFLDGHSQMFVYPFESQLGTRLVQDHLSSMFPVKYRWPVFDLQAGAIQDYKAIIDEECKVRTRTPNISKFRHMAFDLNDDERCSLYEARIADIGRSRANNVEAFFRATFEAWKDYNKSGKEEVYVGYSPIIVVDGATILAEMPQAHVLHVVRNPWSAYAETKKRPVPLFLERYLSAWVINQYYALIVRDLYPNRMHIVRYEDVCTDSETTLGNICEKMNLKKTGSLKSPTWNAAPLKEIYPWGTIRKATLEQNRATAESLTDDEKRLVRIYAQQYLKIFEYEDYI